MRKKELLTLEIAAKAERLPTAHVGRLRILPRFISFGFASLFLAPTLASAQLLVDSLDSGTLSAADAVDILIGPNSNVTVSNVSMTGDSRCVGVFSGGAAVGFDEGVLISSGQVTDAAGPNSSDETTSEFFTPGDAFLDSLIPGEPTYDACVLEFDFTCDGADVVRLDYVMGSEEFNEFVGEEANDVFGFALNNTNIATIPGSGGLPVSIANINCGNPFDPNSANAPLPPFCNLFINNDLQDGGGQIDLEADGLTTVLRAESPITDGTQHMKFAVGDVLDEAFDTWVFLKAGSFQCDVNNAPLQSALLLTSRCTIWGYSANYANEDIISVNEQTHEAQMLFDGSDVGLESTRVDAFYQAPNGDIYLSISDKKYLNGVGYVDDEDILRFIPSSIGNTTQGTFEMFFDGSNNQLSGCGVDIDALDIDEGGAVTGTDADNDGIANEFDACPLDANNDIDNDGICGNVKIYFSLENSIQIDGVWYADEDIVMFDESTNQYSMFFDGSDVGLSPIDIDAVKVMADQSVLFSVKWTTDLNNIGRMHSDDIYQFVPSSLGATTQGVITTYQQGHDLGLSSQRINFNGIDRITF